MYDEVTTAPQPRIEEFRSLLGDRVRLADHDTGSEGRRPLEFEVAGLDPLWPLRLPRGWRLCESSQPNTGRCSWVLEHAGEVHAIETVEGRRQRGALHLPMEFALRARFMLQHRSRPRPLLVTIAGPDGSGKSTVAADLVAFGQELRLRTTHQHFSPGMLPRPGALLRRKVREWSTPHAAHPHDGLTSLLLLGYFWLDFLLDGWRARFARAQTALIVRERGWWDVAVDPRRYRLEVSPALVRALGRVLPRGDLMLVLEASAETIVARKGELAPTEVTRQVQAWRETLPRNIRRAYIDGARSKREVVQAAREEVLDVMDARTTSHLGSGWVAVPRPGRGNPTPSAPHHAPRLMLPRGPRAAVAAALYAYHPCSKRGRLAWEASRFLATLGLFRLMPRGAAPPRAVRDLLAPYLPPRSTIAVAESDHPGRFVALIVEEHGACHGVAKLATTAEGQVTLDNEARALGSLTKLLPPPLSAPRMLARDTGLLLLEAVRWVPRRRPWMLDEEVAKAMGAFFAANGAGELTGPTHGDFAPWNLLQTDRGWVLVDWEDAREEDRPFYDLFHYLFMAHLNLHAFPQQDLLDGLEGKGWVGRAITAYAEGAGLRDVDPQDLLIFYLHSSSRRLNLSAPDGRSDFRARQRLLDLLET